MTETPRNDAAMAEILASMRRIVAESDQRSRRFAAGPDDPDILVLTPEMRIDAPSAPSAPSAPTARPPEGAKPATAAAPVTPPAEAVAPPPPLAEREAPGPTRTVTPPDDAAALLAGAADSALDEAAVADIVRAVLREEFNGAFGRSLTQQIRTLVQSEVSRTLAARQQGD